MAEALRVLVAEDEPFNRKRLARLLTEAGCRVVAELRDGTAVLEWLEAGGQADAAFLDIDMPGASGLEVAAELPKSLPVIFVTAHSEFAVRAFETAALDYLLKPASAERVAIALARLKERRGTTEPVRPSATLRYPVRAGSGLVFIDLARTTHFVVEDEVVWAHVGGERHRTSWKSLPEVEVSFPPGTLVRGHRNMLVRPEAVVGVRAGEFGKLLVRVQGGMELEVSRGAAPGLKARLGI
ncbi:MAG: LytTR family DNA-binding domain-containing protein [Firmicutes bacterium]|nr:LytTR family DNA-binding domain-containing protein [Bacillota bacterium]